MSTVLPHSLDPWRAVRNRLSFVGQVAPDELVRLKTVLAGADDTASPVHYQLHFESDRAGHNLVSGRVQAQLRLPCQRCLGVVEITIDVPVRLGLVKTEALAEALPADLDPLVVTDERVAPLALIEDELLLALPTIARHNEGECQPPLPAAVHSVAITAVIANDGQKAPHPFAVLRTIKSEQIPD